MKAKHLAALADGLVGYRYNFWSSLHCAVKVDVCNGQLQDHGWGEMLSEDDTLGFSGHSSVESLIILLQNCRKAKNLASAKCMYMFICNNGLEAHRGLGTHLVRMFIGCGSLSDAQQVLYRLIHRNEYCWTSLIQGYADSGEAWHALILFQEMQEDGVYPSKYTFTALMKACARVKCVERGQEIHSWIAKEGLEKDVFVSNSIVDMYAKCGLLAEAWEVFNNLSVRDVVSWTALITGYAEHGLGEEALSCFERMQLEAVAPNAVTFLCSLRACGSLGVTDKGRKIHYEITKEGFERDLVAGSTLMDMYAKCGSLVEAQEMFDKLPVQDAVLWNALIAGYAEQGLTKEVLNSFKRMQLEGMCPNAVTFVCSLKACGNTEAIGIGREIHAKIAKAGFERDSFIGSTLTDMYAKCGSILEAKEVFDKLQVRDVVSWTALITGYAEQRLGEETLECLQQMRLEGASPNAVTYVCCLKACGCGSIGAIERGREVHNEITKQGYEINPSFSTSLVDMYVKCGSLAEGREVFEKLPSQDVVVWTALIAGFAEHGLGEEGLNCLERMQLEDISPNAVTYACSLKACGTIGAIGRGREIHSEIGQKGLRSDLIVDNSLIDMYARCGSLAEARGVFDKLKVRDVVSWNSLMAGYARHGESELLFPLIDEMRREGIQPDEITLLNVLTVCSHAGLVEKGQRYFEAMGKEFGIITTIEHQNCMVDLLARAGQLDEAVAMLEKMPFQPDVVTWSIMLFACQKWGNLELGQKAFECAVRLDEKYRAAFILMSNIYADSHILQDFQKRTWEKERLTQAA